MLSAKSAWHRVWRFFCMLFTGEAVNVSSGLGYNGVDEKGKARWDLIDNADILQIEVLPFSCVCNRHYVCEFSYYIFNHTGGFETLFINVRRCHYEMMKYYCDIPCLCSIVLLVCKSICLAHNNQESLALKYTCFNHLKRLYMENIFTVCCTKLWVRFSSLPQKFAVLPLNGSLWLKKVATLLPVVVSYGFLCPPSDAIASAHYIE